MTTGSAIVRVTTRPRRSGHACLLSFGVLAGSVAVCLLASGCASADLERSRASYFRRDPAAALASFPSIPNERHNNTLLYLLERATILQSVSNYTDSAADFLSAAAVQEALKVGSVSESSGSMIVNDMAKSFRGVPYEQVLLHAFAAKNYLALGQIDDAAVEARNVLERLSGDLDGFPDNAYARYLAGACLELTGDRDGATVEYRKAASLLRSVAIEPETGRLFLVPAPSVSPSATNTVPGAGTIPCAATSVPRDWNRDMVCFLGMGILGPARDGEWHNSHWGPQPYADIYVNGVFAGRSAPLSDTYQLHMATQARLAAAKAAKTVVRVGLKIAAVNAVSQRNDALGLLAWILLVALENEDLRRWETLPRWLHTARVPCPDKITAVRVVFRRAGGTIVEDKTLPPPPARSSHLTMTFTRAL